MIVLFSIFKLILIVCWSLFCIFIAVISYLFTFSDKTLVFLAKYLWSGPLLFLLGATIEVEGKEHVEDGENYLIFANHCSYADIPTLFYSIPLYLRFIGKNELKKVPFLGWYMRMAGMIFIDRSKPRRAKKSLDDAAKLAQEGKNIVIFPEGTTIVTGEIAPFKRGCHSLATLAEKNILPVRIYGTLKVWPISSNLKLRNGKIKVVIGPPIKYDQVKDLNRTEFLKEMREKIIEL